MLDFFHASEHLHAAVYGDGTRDTQYRYETLRETLRDDESGVAKVIRALDHLRKKCPRSQVVARCAAYFRRHRHRMNYAAVKGQGFMIGSGVVEAACKTLVAQRLKLSGMRWGRGGAQAILTARGWDQSERFDEAWARLAATYQIDVHVLANVVALRPLRRRAFLVGERRSPQDENYTQSNGACLTLTTFPLEATRRGNVVDVRHEDARDRSAHGFTPSCRATSSAASAATSTAASLGAPRMPTTGVTPMLITPPPAPTASRAAA